MSSPFDESRYRELLKGLEAVELNLSYVLDESEDFRIESEFFKKEYRDLKDTLLSKPHEKLLYFLKQPVQTGHTPSMQNQHFYGGDIKFIKTDNLHDNYIKPYFNHYLTEAGNNEIQRTSLKAKDILTTIIGATHNIIARSCIVNQEILPANINQNIALIRVEQNRISPEFLNIYLNTSYGKKYLHYLSRQMEQVNLNCREVEQVLIPLFSNIFQLQIERIVNLAHKDLSDSSCLYNTAENILFNSIGLDYFKHSYDNINIKNFLSSFGTSGRLDAEYYMKKYEEIISHIINLKYDYLSNLVNIKKSIEPGSDAYAEDGFPFLRVSDYNRFGITFPEKKLSSTYIKENESQIENLKPKKGTILFSKDGSVGIAYLLLSDADLITSSAILQLTMKENVKILPEYLALTLNSKLVQMQAERDSGGSIILHWRINEIEKVLIPIIDFTSQEKIAQLMNESFIRRNQSDRLFEIAKKAVEIAVKTDEESAIKYLNKEIDEQ